MHATCTEIYAERVGGEVYIVLPAYNDIFTALLPYTVLLSLAHLNFTLHVSMRAYMPSLLPFFKGQCALDWTVLINSCIM